MAVETTITSREMPPVLEYIDDSDPEYQDENVETTHAVNTGNDIGISPEERRKYSPKEWHESNYAKYLKSFTDRENSKTRDVSTNLINSTQAILTRMQDDVTKKLGERILDITFWKFEAERAIKDLSAETDLLAAHKNQLENAYRVTELPLHISTDNLNCRLRRQGLDLVDDSVEKGLLKEVKIINEVRDLLKKTIARAEQQITTNCDAKEKLEMDWSDKKVSLEIDNRCGILRNHHTDKQYFSGGTKLQKIQSSPESWAQFTHENIVMAENERTASIQLYGLIGNIFEDTSRDMVEQHNKVLIAFKKRLQEMEDTKFKMQSHLQKVCRAISEIEDVATLEKAIQDKEDPLKMAQTRLEARSYRPGVELCRDLAQYKLIAEVDEINNSLTALSERLDAATIQLKSLQVTRIDLEKEISNKTNSIFIDRQKCLALRERYPSSLRLKGLQ